MLKNRKPYFSLIGEYLYLLLLLLLFLYFFTFKYYFFLWKVANGYGSLSLSNNRRVLLLILIGALNCLLASRNKRVACTKFVGQTPKRAVRKRRGKGVLGREERESR